MPDEATTQLWRAARPGHPQLWIGPSGRVPPPPTGRRAIRVRCDAPGPALGPLRRALAEAERLLGGRASQTARSRQLTAGPRLDMLAADPLTHPADALRAALRQVESVLPGLTLVLEGLDGTDQDTADFAARILAGAPWPGAVILGVADGTAGIGASLLHAAGATAGTVAAPGATPAPTPLDPTALPTRARRAAQALAVAGAPVSARVLGALLDRPPMRVLEDLQAAADGGLPIEDLGDGLLALRPDVAGVLRAGLLPALQQAWRGALVDLLDPRGQPSADTPPPEPAAAAAHLDALGAPLEAARRLARAAEQALAHHATAQAQALAYRGVELLAGLAESDARGMVLAELLDVGAAAVHAQAGDGGADLGTALALADRAWAALPPDAPPALSARLRARAAAICYDRGDAGSLERALGELTEAIRELQAAGQPREAARLLNDQAAVWVRLGDPVRAAGLLDQSREVFSGLSDPSPEDEAETAETLHLLARLPLHVRARAGVEAQAVEAALEHARDARRIYQRLGWAREAARTQETMGRLALRGADPSDALALLAAAAREQQAHADALGLARTTAALAEAIGREGELGEALELLSTSIELNHRVGSGGGLRINLAALAGLPAEQPQVAHLRREATRLLEALEGPPTAGG